MNVTLVASSNGLGHARRLMHLSAGFLDHGMRTTLVLTEYQIEKLKNEIETLGLNGKLRLHATSSRGLDAFASAKSTPKKDLELGTIKLLDSSDLVISDNSLWPVEFCANLFLFGHFDWVTYFGSNESQMENIDGFKEEYEKELELLEKVSLWFRTKDFYIQSRVKLKYVETPLLKYATDPIVPKMRIDEIWLSFGTTGRNGPKETQSFSHKFKFRKLESWTMSTSNEVPKLIIGRPGIGTIRDCLANRVLFVSHWMGIDSELAHNEQTMSRLNLSIPFETLEHEELDDHYYDILGSHIDQYWQQSSATALEIVESILRKM